MEVRASEVAKDRSVRVPGFGDYLSDVCERVNEGGEGGSGRRNVEVGFIFQWR